MKDAKLKYDIGEVEQSASSSSLKVDELAEKKRNQKKLLIKMGAMGVLTLILLIFSSLAWFTMNREVEGTGMGIKSQGMPYTIVTRTDDGYYKTQWESLGTEALEWKMTAAKNFDNHKDDLDGDETEPGLEPGDSGILEFRVQPNTADSITIDCIFDMKAYLETTSVVDGETVTNITEIDNDTLTGYVKAHIMLFAGQDEETGKYTDLIGNDEDLKRVLKNQTYTKEGEEYTTIFWVWPMHLSELTSENNSTILYDADEREDVIAYMASNRTGFFRDCTDSEEQVTADLTALSTAFDNQIYNRYNIKYDNADLEIGNNISYVMLSMNVKQ